MLAPTQGPISTAQPHTHGTKAQYYLRGTSSTHRAALLLNIKLPHCKLLPSEGTCPDKGPVMQACLL